VNYNVTLFFPIIMANTAKLLILQGGRCFYCREPLALEDATLEHVIPKAQGGDASEANTVACCAAMNHLLGNATPKEKLAAVLNADGKIACPQKSAPPKAASAPAPIPSAEPNLSALAPHLNAAYQAAAAVHSGARANLSAIGLELRKRVDGFSAKKYGHKQFGTLVSELGYDVSGQWAVRRAKK
jgi:hypothetical protein